MKNWPVQMMIIILCLLSFTACGGGGGGDTTTATTTQLDPDPVDTSAPGIGSRTPGPNATQVNLDSNIVVAFSESMATISINSVTFRVIDPVLQVPLHRKQNGPTASYSSSRRALRSKSLCRLAK